MIDYTTASDVFAYGNSLGTATTPVNEAGVMADLVTGMSRGIDRYCNQVFCANTYTNELLRAQVDLDGVLTCYPPVPSITSISAASYRSGASASYLDLQASDLDVEQNTFGCVVRVLSRGFLAYRGMRLQMRLSYTGGWAALSDVPADFEWAMRALCWWAYQKRSAPTEKTAIPEMGVLVIPGNWPGHIKHMFKNYVRQVPM